jgi:hypothetical protein
MDVSFSLASAEITINFVFDVGFSVSGLERGYGTMTFANTVRFDLDFVSIKLPFRSDSYLDTLGLLDLVFQRRLMSAINDCSVFDRVAPASPQRVGSSHLCGCSVKSSDTSGCIATILMRMFAILSHASRLFDYGSCALEPYFPN